jgi:hypothetical protein
VLSRRERQEPARLEELRERSGEGLLVEQRDAAIEAILGGVAIARGRRCGG